MPDEMPYDLMNSPAAKNDATVAPWLVPPPEPTPAPPPPAVERPVTFEDFNAAAPSEPLPVFDLEEVSWSDMKRLQVLRRKMSAMDPENETAILDLAGEIETILETAIVSIPDAWFVRRATAEQRTGPGRLGWLKSGKFEKLFSVFDTSSDTETASGN